MATIGTTVTVVFYSDIHFYSPLYLYHIIVQFALYGLCIQYIVQDLDSTAGLFTYLVYIVHINS